MANRIINIKRIGYMVGTATTATECACVGSLEISAKAVNYTRKCGAFDEPVKSVMTGAGALTIEAHCDNATNEELQGLKEATKKLVSNTQGATRPWATITAEGEDEDGNAVVFAATKCLVTADESAFTFDNGSTEIPYISQEVSYKADTNKKGFYLLDEADLPIGVTVDGWISGFNSEMAAKVKDL